MKTNRLMLIMTVCALLASCSSKRMPMEYFVDIDRLTAPIPVADYSIKIEPSDELYIAVTSRMPEVTADYNLPASNPATNSSLLLTSSPRQQTYIVDPKGDIDYPVLGRIHVQGMTVEQLRDYIYDHVSKEVESPNVVVKLIDFKVNVSGEVNRPGQLVVTSPRFSILDAIAQAGDLTQYGVRENVLLVREEDGERKHIRLNLNSADLLSSPYFFLKQNDYIYVQPNDVRKDNAEYSQYNSYKLSVVSTVVSASASIISLVIALTR